MNGRLREWRCVAKVRCRGCGRVLCGDEVLRNVGGPPKRVSTRWGKAIQGRPLVETPISPRAPSTFKVTDPTYAQDDQGEFFTLEVGLADQPGYVEGWSLRQPCHRF